MQIKKKKLDDFHYLNSTSFLRRVEQDFWEKGWSRHTHQINKS
jgi:hypothetical protein